MDDWSAQASAMRPGFGPTGSLVAAVRRFLIESLPVVALGHSFHIDALTDLGLRADPAFQRFSQIELNELHHQVAALGALLRLERGEASAWRSLGTNLAGFLQNREAALTVAGRFSPAVVHHPTVQRMMDVVVQSNRDIRLNLPVLTQAVELSGAPSPGPMLVGL